MKIKGLLNVMIIIIMIFTSCNENKKEKGWKEEVKENKLINSVKIKKSKVTSKQIKKLSDIFSYGNKLTEQKKKYQKEIYELAKNFKNIKNPLSIKKNSEYKYTRITYFSSSIWIAIYSSEKMTERSKLFRIVISYKGDLSDSVEKSYNKDFMGYPALYLKDKWVKVLLKNNMEIKIIAINNSVKNENFLKNVLKNIRIEEIESVFNETTEYPELKEYFLKIKKIKSKITDISQKFKEMENEAVSAIKPFIFTDESVLKGFDLSKIYFTDNTFSISVRKKKKILLSIHIGRVTALGLLSYLKNKNLIHKKIENIPVTILKNNIVIAELPNLAVKATTYFKNEFKNSSRLLEVVFSMDLKGLSKIK